MIYFNVNRHSDIYLSPHSEIFFEGYLDKIHRMSVAGTNRDKTT